MGGFCSEGRVVLFTKLAARDASPAVHCNMFGHFDSALAPEKESLDLENVPGAVYNLAHHNVLAAANANAAAAM